MYIWLFSRSVGAGSATTRNTRGLTRSVIALIVPPLPAPSRPSKTMQTLSPLCLTHSWTLTSSTCSFFNSRSYSLPLISLRSSESSSAASSLWRLMLRPLTLKVSFGNRAGRAHLGARAVGVFFEVAAEQTSQLLGSRIVAGLVAPGVPRDEDLAGHLGASGRHVETEDGVARR